MIYKVNRTTVMKNREISTTIPFIALKSVNLLKVVVRLDFNSTEEFWF